MLTPTRGTFQGSLFPISDNTGVSRANPGEIGTSFAQQLAESLEGYLTKSKTGARLDVEILPTQGGNSGTHQFLVTVRTPDGMSPSSLPTASPSGFVGQAAPVDTSTRDTTFTNEVDAYWASQPPEVQILRTIQDADERAMMGQRLAHRGFAIDANIMIHGWDPYMTMKIRQGEGYTWVPAVGQNGIPVSPGLIFPGLPSYDPAKPPQGSIRVSTDFAVGLEHTSPGAGLTNWHKQEQS